MILDITARRRSWSKFISSGLTRGDMLSENEKDLIEGNIMGHVHTELCKGIRQQQRSICETRKGANRPQIRRGIDYLVYAHL